MFARILIAMTASACIQAHAAAPISAANLLKHCEAYVVQPSSDAGQLCAAYVRGFLHGVKAREDPSDKEETWSDRALRTRLGHDALARTSYCVPAGVSVEDLISKTIDYLQVNEDASHDPASAAIEAALRAHYPCVKSADDL